MALRHLMRRTASSVVPLAIRSAKQQRTVHSALGFAVQSRSRKEVSEGTAWRVPRRNASAVAKSKVEENLLRVLDSEIKCAVESDSPTEDVVPDNIPFTIEDVPGEQTITLRRKYGNEDIKVEVMAMDLAAQEGDDEDEEGGGQPDQPRISLTVTVSKGEGPSLEFNCSGYADELKIDVMAVKEGEPSADRIGYEGPDFNDLDENLQKGMHKYLEVRGIKASLSNFLHEYMINKDSKEYIRWLQNVKAFVEKQNAS